jgi:hypothetical protein
VQGCITFHYLQFGRALGFPFTTTTTNSFFKCRNVGRCPASSQSGTVMNKNSVAEAVRYRNKGTQSGTGMLRYQTEIQDAGIDLNADAQLCQQLIGNFISRNTFCPVQDSGASAPIHLYGATFGMVASYILFRGVWFRVPGTLCETGMKLWALMEPVQYRRKTVDRKKPTLMDPSLDLALLPSSRHS